MQFNFHARRLLRAAAILLISTAIPATSFATVTISLENPPFSGSAVPGGTLDVSFTETSSGVITMTVTNNLSGAGTFVDSLYLNLDPDLVATTTVAYTSGQVGTPSAISANAYKADGDGKYDVLITFPTPAAQRFEFGESAVFTFTGMGLTESSFNFLSQPDGGHGPFIVAAHVQGFGSSGWITTAPEPATLAIWTLFAMSAAVPQWFRRRRTTNVT